MLVIRRPGDELELIAQPDHAAVAGALAAGWGTGPDTAPRFAAPRFAAALLTAAHHHDDGWRELEDPPRYNPAAARPAHFTEVPLADSIGPYGRGVESVYARDPLAGALCSMHWSGFSTSRWGAGGEYQSEDPLAQRVIADAEARWMPALRRVWANRGRRSAFDAEVWFAYELLQAVDLLSLGLGQIDSDRAADGPAVAVTATLASVDQPAAPRTVDGVPLAPGGEVTQLTLTPRGAGRVVLDPFPLSDGALTIAIPVRRIADRPYGSAEEAASAWHAAPARVREVTVVASDD